MNIQRVDVSHVHQVWPMVEKFIDDALAHAHGEYTVEQAKSMVAMGHWTLLVAVEDNTVHGAATMSFFNRPSDRVAFITTTGGRFVTSAETFAQLRELAASLGATSIEAAARESVARMLSRYGFEEKYRIVGVKI